MLLSWNTRQYDTEYQLVHGIAFGKHINRISLKILIIIFVAVGARKRQAVHGIQKAPPVSGDCFWQLEKTDNPLNSNYYFVICNL